MKRYSIYIIIICLILSIALGIGMVWPAAKNLAETKGKIKIKEVEIQYSKEYISKLELLSEKLQPYQIQLTKISNSLPEDPSLPTLFDFLQKAASQNGLILKNITIVSKTPFSKNPKITETHLNLILTGSYSALKDFLSSLYLCARIIEIENISFSSPAEGETFTFNLTIKAYSY